MEAPQTEITIRGGDGTVLLQTTVTPGEYVLGRSPQAELFFEADLVSRQHARLTVNFDHLLIEDLRSANGTSINGRPITEPTRLWPNQKVQIGTATLEFRRLKTVRPPDVSLAPSQAAMQRLLPEELLREKKYDIGKVVAQGGMGAILDARDAATERTVAMKVMLDGSSPDDLARFVTEAKVTAQLEHPNIVPVHELSVDENGQPFYTMKMVRGITLKKVLELLTDGVEATVKKYPLPALLTIFQKVCDALAFAHARGVIHRDLKPENVMLDDFGVVLVMDWGLAKKTGGHRAVDAPNPGTDGAVPSSPHRSSIHTVPPEAMNQTLAGTIMGTPAYMSPEQARGEVDDLDARSDIYALGAILYQILALRPPVTGRGAMEIVDKVARGEIEPLVAAVYDRRTSSDRAVSAPKAGDGHRPPLQHLPGGRVPDSLAAVVRKAMAFDKAARYATVAELQRDLEAYQNGRATSAEKAGLGKHLLLALRRHKIAAAGVAAVLLVGATLGSKALIEGRRAEREGKRALRALLDLKATAPDLLALAASEAALQRYESALKKTDAALALDPALRPAYWRRGWLLLAQEKLPEAVAALRLAQAQDPANRPSATVLPLVEKMAAASGAARYDIALIKPLYDQLSALGALGEAAPLVPHLKLGNDARLALVRERVGRWLGKPPGTGGAAPSVNLSEGQLQVNLNGLRISSLDPLRGLPIDNLKVANCGLTNLEPLRGMDLVVLLASSNAIEDLGPLEGMPLEWLSLYGNSAKDLSPLHGMPLKVLTLHDCHQVTDLRPLSGMPLEELDVYGCAISDFSALRGMPLHKLDVSSTRFADGRVLAWMPLAELTISNAPFTDAATLVGLPLRSLHAYAIADFTPLLRIPTLESLTIGGLSAKLQPLRQHPGLKQIRINADPYRPVAEFWAAYDAQQAAGKK